MTHPLPRLTADDVVFTPMRAQGAGGQHVNKASTAVHLRFSIDTAHLPDAVKERLRELADQRVTEDGVVVIKAQGSRSQVQNKADALARLQTLVDRAAQPPKPRRATKPTAASRRRRLTDKTQRSQLKQQRRNNDAS